MSNEQQNEQMACMEVWGGNSETDTAVDRPGLSCRVYNRSYGSGDAGGDVYYLSSCASGRLTRFLLADVCGHGESAADSAVTLRQLMRQNVNRIRQTQLVKDVNRELAESDISGRFATALIGTWFSPSRQMVLSNAGHPIPLLYRASTATWSLCDTRSKERVAMQDVPLGIDDRATYSEYRIQLDSGDLLLCYTDALPESLDEHGDLLTTSGLIEILQSLAGTQPDELIHSVLDQLGRSDPRNLDRDDVSVMLFEATAKPVSVIDSLLAPWRYLQNLVVDRTTIRKSTPVVTPERASSTAI